MARGGRRGGGRGGGGRGRHRHGRGAGGRAAAAPSIPPNEARAALTALEASLASRPAAPPSDAQVGAELARLHAGHAPMVRARASKLLSALGRATGRSAAAAALDVALASNNARVQATLMVGAGSEPLSEEDKARVRGARDALSPPGWGAAVASLGLGVPRAELAAYADRLAANGRAREAAAFAAGAGVQAAVADPQALMDALGRESMVGELAAFARGDAALEEGAVRAAGRQAKAARKLIKLFGRRLAEFPDVVRQTKRAAITYLVRSGDAAEFGADVAAGDEQLQIFLVQQLLRHDTWTAAAFARHFGLVERNPGFRRPAAEHPDATPEALEARLEAAAAACAAPSVPDGCRVLLVDGGASLAEAERELEAAGARGDRVGLDAEFVPSFLADDGVSAQPALLQVACGRSCVLLFDMLAYPRMPRMDTVLAAALSDQRTLKLGYGFKHDILMLQRGAAEFGGAGAAFRHVGPLLDLDVPEKRFDVPRLLAREGGTTSAGGLGRLAELCLGYALDKGQQVSNWKRRPLREQQMQYAAMDAVCLVDVYERVRDELARRELARPAELDALATGRR